MELKNNITFVKVVDLMKSKDPLTKEGVEKIKIIKSNMNSYRIHNTSNSPSEAE